MNFLVTHQSKLILLTPTFKHIAFMSHYEYRTFYICYVCISHDIFSRNYL